MTPARLRWGLLLVQIGTLLILKNMDIINLNFLGDFVYFLAMFFIAVGIEKIFTKTRLQFISYLSVLALFFGGFALALSTSLGGSEGSFFSQTSFREELPPDAKSIKAVLRLDETDLMIRDSGSDLVYGKFDKLTKKPNTTVNVVNGVAEITMASQDHSFLGGAIKINTDEPQEWYLRFTDQLPLNLECYGDGASMHLNMATSRLESLRLEADQSDIYIRLGNLMPRVVITVDGEDSNLEIRIPEDIGVMVRGEKIGSYLKTIGLEEKNAGIYTNPGFDTMSSQVELQIDERLSGIKLDYF